MDQRIAADTPPKLHDAREAPVALAGASSPHRGPSPSPPLAARPGEASTRGGASEIQNGVRAGMGPIRPWDPSSSSPPEPLGSEEIALGSRSPGSFFVNDFYARSNGSPRHLQPNRQPRKALQNWLTSSLFGLTRHPNRRTLGSRKETCLSTEIACSAPGWPWARRS